MTGKELERRKRLAAYRAIAPLAVKEHQPDEVEEADDEKPREDLPQVSRTSHYS
jgi:hypothetical protein